MVKQNILTRVGAGIAIEGKGSAERVAVDNNELFDVAAREGADTPFGIVLLRAESMAVAGNTLAGVGAGATSIPVRAGIVAVAADDIRVTGNVVDTVGPQSEGGFLGLAVGIVVSGPFNAASVSDNSARFGTDRLAPSEGTWTALMVMSAGASNVMRLGAGKGRRAGGRRRRRPHERLGVPRRVCAPTTRSLRRTSSPAAESCRPASRASAATSWRRETTSRTRAASSRPARSCRLPSSPRRRTG